MRRTLVMALSGFFLDTNEDPPLRPTLEKTPNPARATRDLFKSSYKANHSDKP